MLFLDSIACGFYYAKDLETSLIALNYNTHQNMLYMFLLGTIGMPGF